MLIEFVFKLDARDISWLVFRLAVSEPLPQPGFSCRQSPVLFWHWFLPLSSSAWKDFTATEASRGMRLAGPKLSKVPLLGWVGGLLWVPSSWPRVSQGRCYKAKWCYCWKSTSSRQCPSKQLGDPRWRSSENLVLTATPPIQHPSHQPDGFPGCSQVST